MVYSSFVCRAVCVGTNFRPREEWIMYLPRSAQVTMSAVAAADTIIRLPGPRRMWCQQQAQGGHCSAPKDAADHPPPGQDHIFCCQRWLLQSGDVAGLHINRSRNRWTTMEEREKGDDWRSCMFFHLDRVQSHRSFLPTRWSPTLLAPCCTEERAEIPCHHNLICPTYVLLLRQGSRASFLLSTRGGEGGRNDARYPTDGVPR